MGLHNCKGLGPKGGGRVSIPVQNVVIVEVLDGLHHL